MLPGLDHLLGPYEAANALDCVQCKRLMKTKAHTVGQNVDGIVYSKLELYCAECHIECIIINEEEPLWKFLKSKRHKKHLKLYSINEIYPCLDIPQDAFLTGRDLNFRSNDDEI